MAILTFNVSQSDLINSEPCCTIQDPWPSISSIWEMDLNARFKCCTTQDLSNW